MSLLRPPRTPGVVAARFQTLRPFSGSSTIARSPIVSETTALSVFSTCALASTFTDSVSAAHLQHRVRAHDLVVGDLDARRLEGLEAGEGDR